MQITMGHNLRKDKRGVSNIIVVVLSLIIIVVIVANVILWSYQMNQIDWERMQENLSIESIAEVPFTSSYNPSGYTLVGSTSWLSGGISNLVSNNGVYMTFRSYYSGTDTSDFVDNICDLYPPSAKGTHSNFAAQQTGPDSVYDMLREENAGVTDNWGITSSTFSNTSTHTTYRYMGGTSPNIDNMKVTKLHIRYSWTGTVAIGLYTGGILTDPTGATKRTEAYNVAVSSGWNTIDVPDYNWVKNTITWIGWCHGGGGIYYSTNPADSGDFQSTRGRWDQTTPSDANEASPMPTNPDSGSFDNFWYAIYVEYETVNYNLDLEVQWTSVDYNQANETLATYVRKGDNTRSLDATGGYMIIGNGMPNWGSTTGTISFWINWDTVANRPWGQHDNMEIRFFGSNLVLDWGASSSLTSVTGFTPNKWYFIAIVWNESTDKLYLYVGDKDNTPTQDNVNNSWTSTVSTQGVTQNNFMASRGSYPTDGRGDDLRYWNTARTLVDIQNDYSIELTGSETNLRSYFKLNNNFDDIGPNNSDGSGSGIYSFSSDVPYGAPPTETIRVDVWTGSWQNLFTDLANGWNNVTVSSYLTSSTFTIRFNGGTESGDTVQDSWYIDVTLLHVWTNKYTLEVEFTGSSNTDDWDQLAWTVDSAWTIASVSVTLQLYNYTLGAYPTSGNGYISYTSSGTPNTDETKNQTIIITPTQFRNVSGNWKMKIKGVKETSSQFDSKIDWIEFKPTTNGTRFTFKNKGTLTSRIVSLWIVNSTNHQHYTVDIFVNSGNTLSYSRADIRLPSGQYVVKIVTDRGNAAIYSED